MRRKRYALSQPEKKHMHATCFFCRSFACVHRQTLTYSFFKKIYAYIFKCTCVCIFVLTMIWYEQYEGNNVTFVVCMKNTRVAKKRLVFFLQPQRSGHQSILVCRVERDWRSEREKKFLVCYKIPTNDN